MNANLTTAPAGTELALDDSGRQVVLIEDGKTQCSCSDNCSGRTTRFFSQGHDARLVTRLRNAVQAGMPLAEAFAEILKRGGTERLQIKLDAAVANARKPRKASRKASAKVTTFEVDGFQLQTPPVTTDRARAKVGRWTYEGTLRTHRSAEEGAEKSDTFLVFEFVSKKGELTETLKFREAEKLTEVPEGEVLIPADEEEPEVPILVSLRGDASAEAAREEVAEARANESLPHSSDDFADIPF